MPADLARVVAEKVAVLPIEKQQKVLDFVESIEKLERQTLLEKLEVISKSVPEEVWEKLPADGAENIDHYLYGAQKKGK